MNKEIEQKINKLRMEAEKHGHFVYDILIRNAGYGIKYVTEAGKIPESGDIRVYRYYETLVNAIDGEFEAWENLKEGEERV